MKLLKKNLKIARLIAADINNMVEDMIVDENLTVNDDFHFRMYDLRSRTFELLTFLESMYRGGRHVIKQSSIKIKR